MRVAKEIGLLIADMHNSNIVHGDLTTSESPALQVLENFRQKCVSTVVCLGASFLTPCDIIPSLPYIHLAGVSMIAQIS